MMIIATNWLAFRQEWTFRRGAAGWRASRNRPTQRHTGAASTRHARRGRNGVLSPVQLV
ncbi:MAG: hypothetical protein WHS83_07040 [Chloroflexus sp.]|uniref:hypothetical protein n=1 Tax=Chloroflexus TaxID=1107 RepID=UPI00004590F8|nr:hypothetical protein [Chloroflexus aurantiacus]